VDYQEWRPCPALRDIVLAYWRVEGDGSSVPAPAILPDADVELVINLGDPVMLQGSAFTGRQPPRAAVGLLDRAVRMRYLGQVRTFGVRLHAARAAGFLGVRAAALRNTVAPLRTLSKTLDAHLQRLRDDRHLESEAARSRVESVLVDQATHARPSDALVVRAVDRLLGSEEPLPVTRLARECGVSSRLLHRRFLTAVGTAPKRLERLARFARTWQQATMGPPLTWADLALANGYADQAHLIREFRAFGAEPPAHLFTAAWYDTTTVARLAVRRGDRC
jgi:AraC-like DNA-binding protein